jgi:hypothetical protein
MFADEAAVQLVGAFFTATARSACLLVATFDDLLVYYSSHVDGTTDVAAAFASSIGEMRAVSMAAGQVLASSDEMTC